MCHPLSVSFLASVTRKWVVRLLLTMPDTQVTRSQAVRALSDVSLVLPRIIKNCASIPDASSLPPAFVVVARHLDLVHDTISCIETFVQGTGGPPEGLPDIYTDIKEACSQSCKLIRDLEDLVDAFAGEQSPQWKMKKYQQAVQANGGDMIEEVMRELLGQVLVMAIEPVVEEGRITVLKSAIEELDDVPASLEDAPQPTIYCVNKANGTMLSFSGKGNQNICTGGLQVTGRNDRVTYNFHAKADERVSS
ncbi:hypothetical protein B0I35DRAFT_439616 [Stachybotrys elegans]|uniref:NACHT-NTPase and P-loop NTPases N-terminal domain-containing protein n=1 Tax=Stachybotrys elegans TaxID=80388 RepID=A0A8K0SKH2_9HYPO|nr:hypothetical protein B0I35DRAFT_439616 [Stachybotrys elegans]